MKIVHSVISVSLLSLMYVFIYAQNENKDRAQNSQFQLPSFNVAQKGRQGRRSARIRDTEGTAGLSEGTRNSVVQNASTLVLPSGSRDLDPSGTNPSTSEDGQLLDRAIQLLQRISDRMTALNALYEQQLRRLETLEYRLTKMEVQTQERNDGIKSELREVSQRVRQLDWQNSKMEAALEAIKIDTTGLKHGQDQIRGYQAGSERKVLDLAEDDLNNRLQMTMTAVSTIRAAIGHIKDDYDILKLNITKLNNMTSHMMGISGQFLTKQYFTNAMLDLKHESISPVKVLPQAQLASVNCPSDQALPRDCWEVQQQGHNISGIYRIKPALSSVPFFVYCQLETRGGGWTVVQNRYEGTVDFYRGWHDYKHGFGNIGGEFWLGLEKLHTLTNYKVTELLIELQDFNLDKSYALYSAFAIGTEVEGYSVSFLGSYEGDAGDSLVYHAGMKFSTYDMDHDNWHDGNCAESHTGAWWYNGCDTSNLNGRYLNGELPEMFEYQGMYWYDWHGPGYSLMKSRISVRSSKHSHSHLRVQDAKRTTNKTNKIQGKRKHPTVQTIYGNATRHREYGPRLNITEKSLKENLGKEDSPPINENTNGEFHHFTEYPESSSQYGSNTYDYQP